MLPDNIDGLFVYVTSKLIRNKVNTSFIQSG